MTRTYGPHRPCRLCGGPLAPPSPTVQAARSDHIQRSGAGARGDRGPLGRQPGRCRRRALAAPADRRRTPEACFPRSESPAVAASSGWDIRGGWNGTRRLSPDAGRLVQVARDGRGLASRRPGTVVCTGGGPLVGGRSIVVRVKAASGDRGPRCRPQGTLTGRLKQGWPRCGEARTSAALLAARSSAEISASRHAPRANQLPDTVYSKP